MKVITRRQLTLAPLFHHSLLFLTLCFSFTNSWAQAPVISYQTPLTYTINTPIPTLTPTNIGGTVPTTIYGRVETYAGSGIGNTTGNTSTVSFAFPNGVTTDLNNNVYIADYQNNVIKKIAPNGIVTLFAGNGLQLLKDGPALNASFTLPTEIVTDAAGNVYVADFGNQAIRKITPAGEVSTLAGNGSTGSQNGIGTAATFAAPNGLAIDAAGNIYVADTGNHLIRKITPLGVVTTFAGTGAQGFTDGNALTATFKSPSKIAIDQSGNLFITDFGNNAIRKIDPLGVVSTLAGSGSPGDANGIGTLASFRGPIGIAVDKNGNVFVSDLNNYVIRKILPTGEVSTLAGNRTNGFVNGIGKAAAFSLAFGIGFDERGSLLIADSYNNSVIRKITLTGYSIDKPLPAGLIFDNATGIISGRPAVVSPATSYLISAYNTSGSSSTSVIIQVNGVPPPVVAPNITYSTPQTYTVGNTISTLSPTNTGGAVPATIYGQVSTFAGSGAAGNTNGQGTAASFNNIYDLAADASGNIYAAEYNNQWIRK